jgi:hypothetical protein
MGKAVVPFKRLRLVKEKEDESSQKEESSKKDESSKKSESSKKDKKETSSDKGNVKYKTVNLTQLYERYKSVYVSS